MKYTVIAILVVLLGSLGYAMLQEDKTSEKTQRIINNKDQAQKDVKPSEQDLIEAFYSDTNMEAEFTTTESGLQYAVLRVGDSNESPEISDLVEVHYHGTTADGEVFDSSVLRDETIEFPLRNLVVGWQEGIPLMNVGDKYRLIVPAALAYGEQGAHPLAGKDLTFDIELFSFRTP